MSDLLTIAQAAERCHCSTKTIRRGIRPAPGDPQLRAAQLAGRGCWVIRAEDLDAWIDARANQPRTSAKPVTTGPAVLRPRRRRGAGHGPLRAVLADLERNGA